MGLQAVHWAPVEQAAAAATQPHADMPPEAWVLLLLASNVARVALCGALAFATARWAGVGCAACTTGLRCTTNSQPR